MVGHGVPGVFKLFCIFAMFGQEVEAPRQKETDNDCSANDNSDDVLLGHMSGGFGGNGDGEAIDVYWTLMTSIPKPSFMGSRLAFGLWIVDEDVSHLLFELIDRNAKVFYLVGDDCLGRGKDIRRFFLFLDLSFFFLLLYRMAAKNIGYGAAKEIKDGAVPASVCSGRDVVERSNLVYGKEKQNECGKEEDHECRPVLPLGTR